MDKKQLTNLESVEEQIRQGISSVGRGLIEIQTKKLYRLKYLTFEEYCQQEWGFSRQHCYNLIENHRVSERLSTIVDKPLAGKHLEQLAKLPPKIQATVAAQVLENCEQEGRKPTTKDFAKAVKEKRKVEAVLEIPVDATIDDEPDTSVFEEDEYEDVEVFEDQAPTIEDDIETGKSVAKEILNAINLAMRLLKAVEDSPGTNALWHKSKAICRDLEMAKGGVMNATPHSVCPRCSGNPDGCSACGNHGWVTKLASTELKG